MAGFKFVDITDSVKSVIKSYIKAYIDGKIREVGDIIAFGQQKDIPPSLEESLTYEEKISLDRKLKKALFIYGFIAILIIVVIYLVIRESHTVMSAEAFWGGSIVTVVAPREGIIKEISVREGQKVKPGDLLCLIANAELEEGIMRLKALIDAKIKEIKLLRNLIDITKTSLSLQTRKELIESRIKKIKRLLESAKNKLQRYQRLYFSGYIPRGKLDKIQMEVWNLESELEEEEIQLKNLNRGDFRIENIGVDLQREEAKLRELEAEYNKLLVESKASILRATIGGKIRSIYKLPGEQVKKYEPILAIEAPQKGYIIARYKFRDAEYISVGDEAQVYFPSLNIVVPGKVVAIGKVTLFTANKLQESEEYALKDLPVKIALMRIPNNLTYGMRAEVRLKIKHFRPYIFRYFARLL